MNKTRALFIDRDGVINRMILYADKWDSPQKPDDVKLVVGVAEVIKWANSKKILVIEITNQPGLAKGKQTPETASAIEERVQTLLKDKGVRIDHAYTCPHHPMGVVPELTMECECRKPKPGLLLQAAKELNIDLSKSIFLGDKDSDNQTGKAVGCSTIIFLHDEDELKKVIAAKNSTADYKVTSLSEVVLTLPILFGIDR